MDIAKPDQSPDGISSVKAAISIYGERFHGRKPDLQRSPMTPVSKDSQLRPRNLRAVRFDMGNSDEGKIFGEIEKAMPAKDLAQLMEESAAKTIISVQNKKLKKPQGSKSNDTSKESTIHSTVIEELDRAKQELSLLKIDMASVLQDKAKAEKDAEVSGSRLKSYERVAEELEKEIEKTDEEHLLVELARIEAERERREIEAQKEAEATHFLNYIEIARSKIKDLKTEIDRANELEARLAEANSDVSVLQNEMALVRAMDANKKDSDSDEQEISSALQSAMAELNSAKEELESIRNLGFQFMASMDLLREERMQIAIENQELKHLEKRANSTVQNLKSKLRKAKYKLESLSIADDRSTNVASNLSQALQRLQTDISKARREKETIRGVTETIAAEIEKSSTDMKFAEGGLEAATRELQAVKESEADAMKKLRDVTDRVMKNRAAASPNGSPITICKFEYDYLRRRAAAARGVADKKVAAAHAWVEALRAEEKEIMMKCELKRREIKEQQELQETLVAQRTVEVGDAAEPSSKQITRTKSIRENGRVKARRTSTSSGMTRNVARSPSFMMKKKTAMPGSALFYRSQRSAKQVSGAGSSN